MLRAVICCSLALLITTAVAADEYKLGPDSQRQDGVPKGTVTKLRWTSTVFAKTERDWWIYVPAQYDKATPTAVMVFQDGGGYVNETGQWRVPVVFDNLIARKELPPIIGIFLNPGEFPAETPDAKPRSNRSFEYDTLGDQYARFLVEEILPEVSKTYNLSKDPKDRAVCGLSSGGICSFTVAWEKPDQFAKVMSYIGSFTDIASGKTLREGGHNYPSLIRKTKPAKPLRVFLQDGSSDLDNEHGNWPLANQEMAAALKWAKYDYKFEFGTEGHNAKHGGSIFPDAMRWLWRAEGK